MIHSKYFTVDPEELRTSYPTLHLMDPKDLRGSFPVEFEGRVLDRFSISIDLDSSKLELPSVREIGGRIPWNVDRHVNTDGTACVCLPEDYFLKHPGKFNLITYLRDPVYQFFLGQALVERGDPWPQGEWDHGHDGRKEFYRGLIGTDDPSTVVRYLGLVGRTTVKGHWECPCGSGRKLRDCHQEDLKQMRTKIGTDSAKRMLKLALKWEADVALPRK